MSKKLTLAQLEALPGDFLRVRDVADYLASDPESIRLMTQAPAIFNSRLAREAN